MLAGILTGWSLSGGCGGCGWCGVTVGTDVDYVRRRRLADADAGGSAMAMSEAATETSCSPSGSSYSWSTSTLRGSGTAGMRPVQVEGTGSATWRYRVDPAAGDVREGEGESRTVLTVRVGGEATRFVQEGRTRIR